MLHVASVRSWRALRAISVPLGQLFFLVTEVVLVSFLLLVAALLQFLAVAYGVFLLSRRQGATRAWLFLLGGMLSMLVWRVVVVTGIEPPPFFNPLIAIWGSSCMVVAMFLFGREVSLRRRAESQRDALLQSERAARSEAERASRSKDEFLAALSHELRTPLAAILGWCEVIRNVRDRREQIDRAIETIERNAHAQARLIDDLLDVTRMQAGTLVLDLATVPLGVPVRAAIQAVRPMANAKSISLELRGFDDPQLVRADAGRLQQVAANLIVNAVKFTPSRGTVTVAIDRHDGQARLTVTDTGEGIDAQFLPQLFTRFRQADSSTARRHGGLGLGLSIVAKLVQLHDGQVSASSAGRGRGATFTVTLPLVVESSSAGAVTQQLGAPAAELPAVARLAGLRILLVEDEEDVRVAVARILEQHGASVLPLRSAAGVEEGITKHSPHVLLIDISMPGEDGYTLIRRIRALPAAAGGTIPAISLTAHARSEDRARALSAGFQQHLPKPVDVPVLLSAIVQLVPEADEAARDGERCLKESLG